MLHLYEKRYLHSDALIGTCGMPGTVKSQSGSYLIRNLALVQPVESFGLVPFVLVNLDGQAGHTSHRFILYSTVIVSPNTYPNWGISVTNVHLFTSSVEGNTYDTLFCCQELSNQYERDDDVRTLLKSMQDALIYLQHEDTFKSIKHNSKQAKILTLMLQEIWDCSDFI